MKFAQEQERAKKQSFWLSVWFGIATLAVVLSLNIAGNFLLKFWSMLLSVEEPNLYYNTHVYAMHVFITASSLSVVLGFGAFKWFQLKKGGGKSVPMMLGAKEIKANTEGVLEQRFFNVVEEMSIASGIPMPSCWIMYNETSINAFAAGFGLKDAVICVNRGTLEYLTREELQGVVAHEISHIVNADMRINIRAIAVIAGLAGLMLVGRGMLEIAGNMRNSKNNQIQLALFLIGLSLIVLGFVGSVAGKVISAAISRQREFLADASAVKFTRNPEGIGGALRKIMSQYKAGTSHMLTAKGQSVSHMCLFPTKKMGSFFSSALSTHPDLNERISKIYGGRTMPALPLVKNNLEDVKKEVKQKSNEEKMNVLQNVLLPTMVLPGVMGDFVDEKTFMNQEVIRNKISESLGKNNNNEIALSDIGKLIKDEIPERILLKSQDHKQAVLMVITLMLFVNKDGVNGEFHHRAMNVLAKEDWLNQNDILDIKTNISDLLKVKEEWRLYIINLIGSSLSSVPREDLAKLYILMKKMTQIDNNVCVYEMAILEAIKTFIVNSKKVNTREAKDEAIMKVLDWIASNSYEDKEIIKNKVNFVLGGNKNLRMKRYDSIQVKDLDKSDFEAIKELDEREKEWFFNSMMHVLDVKKHEAYQLVLLICIMLNIPLAELMIKKINSK